MQISTFTLQHKTDIHSGYERHRDDMRGDAQASCFSRVLLQCDVSVSRYHKPHGHVETEHRNENTLVQSEAMNSEQPCAWVLTRPPQLVFIQRKTETRKDNQSRQTRRVIKDENRTDKAFEEANRWIATHCFCLWNEQRIYIHYLSINNIYLFRHSTN